MLDKGCETHHTYNFGESIASETSPLSDLHLPLDSTRTIQYLSGLAEAADALRTLGVVASIQSEGVSLSLTKTYTESLNQVLSVSQPDKSTTDDPLLGKHFPLVGQITNDDLLSPLEEALTVLRDVTKQEVLQHLTALTAPGTVELTQEFLIGSGERQAKDQESQVAREDTEVAQVFFDQPNQMLDNVKLPELDRYPNSFFLNLNEIESGSATPRRAAPQSYQLTEQMLESDEDRFRRSLGHIGQIQMNVQKPILGGAEQGATPTFNPGDITPAAIVASIILTTTSFKAVKDLLVRHQK